MKSPIVIDEFGDISFYASPEDVCLDLEAVDIINGRYVAYDAEGRLINISVKRNQNNRYMFGLIPLLTDEVYIVGCEKEPNHSIELREKILSFFNMIYTNDAINKDISLGGLISLAQKNGLIKRIIHKDMST
jgi:hypothetical protein